MANRASNAILQFRRIKPFIPGPPCRHAQLSISHIHRSMATRMEPSQVKYKYVEEVERLEYYVPGGYHPVMIGDELCAGRYLIAHKLGFDRSATTWLAEDRRQSRLVALKISTAESAEQTHEIQILPQLARTETKLLRKAIVQNLLDSFTFSGPNGSHRCLVTDAARISIHEAKEAAHPFEAFPVTLDEVTIEHVEMLGKLPSRWWSKWEKRTNWFDEDGHKNVKETHHQWHSNSTMNWNQRFTEYIQNPRERMGFDTFPTEQKDAFCDMMKLMLVLEPSKRATTEDIVECEWMQRWGLLEMQRVRDATLKSS
ncbi:hypothetical protein AJ79_00988 [Helicocarpus griseus UAMH5409]|uniref:non-specific serine/threonine protein kinase n=1 Tax=Helicocarpus griseus UAMH5409 TaxID=1447875 RepID=A0A2B7YAK3_9EURO|nr:hypothetical protein AJ79_00988 [Helicocarpus griseus UAMH5409]